MTLAERIAEKLIDITPGVTWTRGERMELLRRVIAAELEERDAKIRRVILAGTKMACGNCDGRGWIRSALYAKTASTDRSPCLRCKGSGEVLSEEAEEALALLEGGYDEKFSARNRRGWPR